MFNTFLKKLFTHWKRIAIIAAILLVVGIVIGTQLFKKENGYVFDTAKKTSITEVVSDSGKITSDGRVDVMSPTNGIITDLYVKNGQTVKKGTNLFRVQSSATEQEKQTAYADYQAAVAAKNAAETLLHTYRSAMFTDWKTYRDLATNSTYESSENVPDEENRKAAEFQSAQDDWLAAEKTFKDQEQAVTAAKAKVTSTWTAYQATQNPIVTAPVDGIVANLSVTPGKSVTALTILNTAATPVLTLVNSTTIDAVLAIGQTDIAKVKTEDRAKIYPDSYKDKEYDGKVTQVDTLGREIQGVVTYNVTISLTNGDDFLRPGMTVDGDIVTNKQENVLTVPNAAVVLYKGKKAVRVLKDGKVTYVPVTVGITGESRTEILNGISEGQQVIVALTNTTAERTSFLGL